MQLAEILTAASEALTDLGVMPFVLAGGVVAIIGMFINAARKIGR